MNQDPYLILRGNFKTKTDFVGIDTLLKFDYMGSAEFEFGVIPQSLRRICEDWDEYELTKTAITDFENEPVYIIAKKDDTQEVNDFLVKLRDAKPYSIPLQEISYFPENISGAKISDWNRKHFWWDLGNHWFAIIGKRNAKNVHSAIQMVRVKKGLA